uniref:Uncharacterized protein n=1 Tax=Storeatula sp. CCMP1868 TaxID=195070 RepID=A0A222AHM0_9CRYP|nr:hypothetical protein [Storeatula sp. CCMP1868]
MEFSKSYIIVSLDGLIGEGNFFSEEIFKNILHSKKTFYQYKEIKKSLIFDPHLVFYQSLTIQILYLLNFKKKFCSKNINRITSNYFKIFYKSVNRKIDFVTTPEQIIKDEPYLNSLALSNLYTINKLLK